MGYDPDTLPAAWLTQRARGSERLAWLLLACAGGLVLAIVGATVTGQLWLVVRLLAAVLAINRVFPGLADQTERWLKGRNAELSVGVSRESLRPAGYMLMHGL